MYLVICLDANLKCQRNLLDVNVKSIVHRGTVGEKQRARSKPDPKLWKMILPKGFNSLYRGTCMEERGMSDDWMEALETYTGISIIRFQRKYLEDLLGLIMLTGFLVMFSQQCVIIRLIDADLRQPKPRDKIRRQEKS